MDTLSKEQRSYCMSRIRSKWTKPELKVHNYLKGHKIKHKMHPSLNGSPDILLTESNTAIFIHGCFWHKCRKCYKEPKSRKDYWLPKIEKNVKKDKNNKELLRKEGYKVIIIWEHQMKDVDLIIKKVCSNEI